MPKYLLVTETDPSQEMEFVLYNCLAKCGLYREDTALLSILGKEKPAGKNGKILKSQRDKAGPRLRDMLAQAEADVVITFGKDALEMVTGLPWALDDSCGYVLYPRDCKPWFGTGMVPTGKVYKTSRKGKYKKGDPRLKKGKLEYAPSLPDGCLLIVPAPDLMGVIKSQWRRWTQFESAVTNAVRSGSHQRLPINGYFTWKDEAPPPGTDWSGVVSFDLETSMTENTDVRRASLATERGCWTFKWDAAGARAMAEAMANADVRVAHNQQFDIPILAAHGIDVPEPTFDTMLAANLLEPDLKKSLAAVAPRYLLCTPWKHWSRERGFDDPEYSAMDAYMERQLALVLMMRLETSEQKDLFEKRIMPSVPVLTDMRDRGIKLDPAMATEFCDTLEKDVVADYRKWHEKYPDVSPSSPAQLTKLFRGTWKAKVPNADKLAIVRIQQKHPEYRDDLELLLRFRKNDRLFSTFGKSVLGQGRVHPRYLPLDRDEGTGQAGKGAAATGRLACSNPNVQQFPPPAKRIFIPDYDDWCFFEADWSQAELRVMAWLSGDEAMLRALDSEGGIHEVTMERLGCDKTRAKNVTFGSSYGAGPRKLVNTLAIWGTFITEIEARNLQNGLARAYPVWWAWREAVMARASAQTYLRNAFGRIRTFPTDATMPAAINYHPQSVVADMAWTCYRQVADTAAAYGGRLTSSKHDSFLVQVPRDVLPLCIVDVINVMEQHFNEVAPNFYCPASVAVGEPGASWGELEEAA